MLTTCSISSNDEMLVHPSFESTGLICVRLGVNPSKYDSLLLYNKHYRSLDVQKFASYDEGHAELNLNKALCSIDTALMLYLFQSI